MKKTLSTAQPEPMPTLSDTCRYCGRVPWGDTRYLGLGQWTHEECTVGSASWLEWYRRQPKEKRTTIMDEFYQFVSNPKKQNTAQ